MLSEEEVDADGKMKYEEKRIINISDPNIDNLWKITHHNILGGSFEAYLSRNGEIIRSQPFQNSSFNYHHFTAAPFEACNGAEIVSFRYQELSEQLVEQQSEITDIEPENKTDLFSPHNFDRLPFHQTCKRKIQAMIRKTI